MPSGLLQSPAMIGKLLLYFWILRWTALPGHLVAAESWSPLIDESVDEKNDAEIFRAVVESMKQWELHKSQRHRTKREVSKVCYEDVGCFEDTGPFSYLEMLPSPPKDVGTRFLVYGSRKARSIPMEVPAEHINENAHRAIDPELPTKVIVHGFGSSCDHVWVYEMRSALMAVHECNLVCVDWGPGSAVPNYVRAAANTRLVGRQLAKLIRSLNVPLEKVHLIGFSLGAHVAGFAGAELGNVSRITGLDPAGPLFESQDPRARLDETDANFVDVIHSNGEQLILGGLGSWQPMGDVDFYPNGGRMQTGCSNLFLGAVSDIIWSSAVEGRSLCNHRRAYKLFTDSVSPKCRFPAFPCDHGYDGLLRGDCFPCGVNGNGRPCGDMGYYSNESPARGQLYLVTRDEEPFCAHQYQVKVYNSRSERPARSYGKLEVTIVGEGSFNETFAMTRKDEELLVGAILQKIVVPHPTITDLEAIEIKYTAYSGWISSGLVSWSIDKVAVVDSFGKTLSVCMRGLILESGRPVRLPLYPGECNIPPDSENSTYSADHPVEHTMEEKSGGIGPFTKDQNYETKDHYSVEVFSNERTSNQKGLGPFTKEENLRVLDNRDYKSVEDTESRRGVSNPWAYVDLANDGGSNSLENTESERGRGFSSSIVVQRTSPKNIPGESTTEASSEIHEPVLQVSKKETGRSMKLPEITEPILRPRATRQNTRNTGVFGEKREDEIQETSSTTSRVFTVQFLPERLAGILAQAEKYARQTLLPLISQYTPSFIVGGRQEEPKYFPPLGPIVDQTDSTEIPETEDSHVNVNETPEIVNDDLKKISSSTDGSRNIENRNTMNSASGVSIVEAIYADQSSKESENNTISITESQDSATSEKEHSWVPVTGELAEKRGNSRNEWNASRSLNRAQEDQTWIKEGGYSWSPRVGNVVPDIETKIDDWVPVTVKETDSASPTETENFADALHATETEPVTHETLVKEEDERKSNPAAFGNVENSEGSLEKPAPQNEDERKYIPLIDFKELIEFSTPASLDDTEETTLSTERITSHIQKIPRTAAVNGVTTRHLAVKTMVFPYAYERIKDPRTRYIPLIPEEDVGRSRSSFDRLR